MMSTRDRILVGAAAAAAAVAALVVAALAPRFERASELGEKVERAESRRDRAEAQARAALAARAAYPANYATVARLGKAVPVDDEVASLIYQLDHAARATGNDFRAIKLTGGSGSTAPAPAAPTAPSPGVSGDATSPTPGGSTPSQGSGSTAPATQAATASLPPGATVGPAGFPAMPFSFTFNGSFFRLEHFLRRVDAFTRLAGDRIDVGGRLLTLNGISLTAAPQGFPRIRAAISATAFLVPATEGLTTGATPGGPATAAAPVGGRTPSGGAGAVPPTAAATGVSR
jgi:hypothetical protein